MDKKTQGKIRELHSGSCKTVSEISEELKIDIAEVVYELEAMGYRPRYEKEKPQPSEFITSQEANKQTISPETKAKIVELREAGKTYQQIVNLTGVKMSSVTWILKQSRVKSKEPAPAATDTSSEKGNGKAACDYHTAFSESCQEAASLIDNVGEWLEGFISDIYNNQSEEWQHGYDVGEKITELKHLMKKARGGLG